MLKATNINEYFVNIADDLAKSIVDDGDQEDIVLDAPYPPVFEFMEISSCDTAIMVHDLKPSTSCGVDGLTVQIIKAAGPSLIDPLKYIINLSITRSSVLACLKTGCVTPLFKEGDPSNSCNYRPISVLPVLGKLIEHIIYSIKTVPFLNIRWDSGRVTPRGLVYLISWIISINQ